MEVAHPQSGSSSTWFLVELEFENVGFWGEGKAEVPGEKPLGARERTNNKLNPHMAFRLRFEPGPLWWEVNALTTVSSLVPCNNSDQQPISPNNNTAWLNIPFMRMKEMIITNDGMSWCLNKFSQRVPWGMYEEQHGESEYAYLIFNYCQKQECFPFKDCMQTEQTALHLRPLNT